MALPTALTLEGVDLKSNSPTMTSDSKSLITLARRVPTHRFEMTLKSTPIPYAAARGVFAFFAALGGQYGTFSAAIPSISTPNGKATGTPVTSGSAAVGATTVLSSGFTASVTGQLLAGDMIKFGNHNKVYQLTADASSNASGQATLQFFPPLFRSVPSGTAITVRDVPFQLRLANDIQEYKLSVQNSKFVRLEIDCIEVL